MVKSCATPLNGEIVAPAEIVIVGVRAVTFVPQGIKMSTVDAPLLTVLETCEEMSNVRISVSVLGFTVRTPETLVVPFQKPPPPALNPPYWYSPPEIWKRLA